MNYSVHCILPALYMSHKQISSTPFDQLPDTTFEKIIDYLDDADIPPFHVASKAIFLRIYEYVRHGREKSQHNSNRHLSARDTDERIARLPLIIHVDFSEHTRRVYVNLKPRFYKFLIIVGRVLSRDAKNLFKAYQRSMEYHFRLERSEQIIINTSETQRELYPKYAEVICQFEEMKAYYQRNISYRTSLFERSNFLSPKSIDFRKSEDNINELARIKGYKIIKSLISRPYGSIEKIPSQDT